MGIQSFFNRYLLPGFVFQGVVIGGGYATGRELVAFFLPHGPIGGLLAMLVSAIVWSLVIAISFELSRLTRSYDYRSFFTQLLGPFWFLFEVLLVLLLLLVLSVVGAASGELIHNLLNVPLMVGTVTLLIIIGVLVFYGSKVVELFISSWSVLVYLCFISLVVFCFVYFPDEIKQTFLHEKNTQGSGWLLDGIRYASYNLAVVPMILFSLQHIKRRKEALTSGLLAGFIGMFPAVLLYVSMMSNYAGVADAPIPSTLLLKSIDIAWFSVVFQVILLGALLQTGVGLIHSVNERVESSFVASGKSMPNVFRSVIAILMLTVSLLLATQFGIIELIGKGYGLLAFGFLAVFVIPVLSVGVFKIWNTKKRQSS
jgi:uncharacterized membrane protein YkvI